MNASSLLESLTCATVGTTEPNGAFEQWSLFPNPTTGAGFSVKLPPSEVSAHLFVFDLLGKVVYQENNLAGQSYVLLNDLPAGVYTVQVLHPAKRFELKQLIIK